MSDLVHLVQPRPDLVQTNAYTYLVPSSNLVYRTRYEEGRNDLLQEQRKTSSSSRDAPHARADPECPRCKETRTFYAHISPDPQRRGPARVEREAASWLQSHPCYLTSAHPKRIHTRGAAA